MAGLVIARLAKLQHIRVGGPRIENRPDKLCGGALLVTGHVPQHTIGHDGSWAKGKLSIGHPSADIPSGAGHADESRRPSDQVVFRPHANSPVLTVASQRFSTITTSATRQNMLLTCNRSVFAATTRVVWREGNTIGFEM